MLGYINMVRRGVVSLLIICSATCCAFCSEDIITKKTTSVIADLLTSEDPAQFAKAHNIELKDGMIKVAITIDEGLLPKDFAAIYGLEEFKIRKNTASAYVKPEALKKMLCEPCVIFVRMPFKLRALFK